MSESDHRPLLFVLILGMMCIVTIAVAAHLVIRKAVRDLVARSAAKQLQMDALAFKSGTPPPAAAQFSWARPSSPERDECVWHVREAAM